MALRIELVYVCSFHLILCLLWYASLAMQRASVQCMQSPREGIPSSTLSCRNPNTLDMTLESPRRSLKSSIRSADLQTCLKKVTNIRRHLDSLAQASMRCDHFDRELRPVIVCWLSRRRDSENDGRGANWSALLCVRLCGSLATSDLASGD